MSRDLGIKRAPPEALTFSCRARDAKGRRDGSLINAYGRKRCVGSE